MRRLVERLTARAWLMPLRPALHISFFPEFPCTNCRLSGPMCFSAKVLSSPIFWLGLVTRAP
jgi:hypothetical protein